ncbi:MAG: type IV pilin protein [Persicimonas sp.]
MKALKVSLSQQRGMTLVELMIVVAVVGVLAAIGGVSYTKYIKSSKVAKLEQYAAEVATAQEQYKSQNSGYLDLDGATYTHSTTGDDEKRWEQLLGFSKDTLQETVEIDTIAGDSSDTSCNICEDVNPSFDRVWYAVRVTQDLDGDDGNDPTTVVLHSELENPMLFNEGQ